MSDCNILDNNAYSVAFWCQVRCGNYLSERLLKARRGYQYRLRKKIAVRDRCGVGNPARVSLPTQFGSIFGESGMLIYALPPVSGIGLVPGCTILCSLPSCVVCPKRHQYPNLADGLGAGIGRAGYILCNPTNYPITTHFFASKIRVLAYILSEHNSWQFLSILSANLKLSLNRGNPTSLINSYLTNMCGLFVAFLYPEGDKKSVKQEGAK